MFRMLQARGAYLRWSVAGRVVAAVAGGYLLTSLLIIAVAILLPYAGVGQAEAVLATSMASFPLYAAIVMAVFHARTATRAWVALIIASVPPAIVYGVFQYGGAG
jgi:hypothetical protein